MKRWPHVALAFTLAGAVAVVCCPHVPEPAEYIPPAETESAAAGAPESLALRFQAKRLVAQEVAAGRRSLVEAAALFRELNRLPPESPPLALLDAYNGELRVPAHTEEDRLCRQVVEWVYRLRRGESREPADDVVARLVAEFQELRKQGLIRLPDSASPTPVQELLEQARKAMTEAERKAIFRPSAHP